MPEPRHRATRSAAKLGLAGALMFAFAVFVLPPLYDAACRLLGINGKNVTVQAAPAAVVDRSRLVDVEFVANVYQGTPLLFEAPSPAKRQVHPGEIVEVSYRARNLSDRVLWAQAVHSIIPGRYGRHVNVLACFCFQNQKFEPGEERTLTFGFTVSPELPPEQSTLSVSYTFFKLENPPEGNP
jgi:cytochrome c oxidase assembly protein subunit 11